MPNKFITENKNESFNFTSVKISNESDRILIEFINEGYATECFVILQCYKNLDHPIFEIFVLSKDNYRMLSKNRINTIRILQLNYSEFIDWITNSASINVENSSGEFENRQLIGLEIRFTKKISSIFPTVLGCELILDRIKCKNSAY